jgi:hypothetical protein
LIVLLAVPNAAAQVCRWDWVNPSPPRIDIHRLKQEVNAFVGVGAAGTVIRSSDGFRWEVVPSGLSGDLFGIDWGGGSFVAVGSGAIIRSTAGFDWETVYSNPNVELLDVEFSMSRFVAVGDGLDSNVLTSVQGDEWAPVPIPWGPRTDSITGSVDGFFAAVGREIWFSPDGFSWQYQGPVPAFAGIAGEAPPVKKIGSDLFELDRVDIAWTGTRLLWAGGSELWSRDPENGWTLISNLGGCAPWNDWLGVIAGPGWAMASGIFGCPTPYLDPTVTFITSTDGGATFRSPWQTELGGFPGMARFGARWVASGALGDVLTSSDGVSWDCRGGNCTSLACADDFVDLAWGDERWVAVGGVGLCDTALERRNGGTAAVSNHDGPWSVHPLTGDRIRGVTYHEPEFIAVGDGWVGRSDDGVDWTTEASPDGAMLNAVGSAEGWVVAVGPRGDLYVSEDGGSWFKPFLYLTEDLDRVVWDGEQFLVLGRAGTILRSGDGMNWTPALTTSTADLKGAAGGDDERVAVGDGGVVLASREGEVWANRRSGVSSHLRDVTWGDDRFAAVGWDEGADGVRPGVILVSTDGIGWTRLRFPGEAPERIRWTGDEWLVVGRDRTIMTTDCLGTHFEVETEHLRVPLGGVVDLAIRLSDEVDLDTSIAVESSAPSAIGLPSSVVAPAGADIAFLPVSGDAIVTGAVLTLRLPDRLGGGSTTVLASVLPRLGTPRTPSGRVSP